MSLGKVPESTFHCSMTSPRATGFPEQIGTGSLRPFVYLQNFEVSKRSVIYITPERRTPSGDDPALAELRNRTLTGAGRAIHHGGRTSVNGLFSFSVD